MSPVHHRADRLTTTHSHIHTCAVLNPQVTQHVCLWIVREARAPKENHTDTRGTCKLNTERLQGTKCYWSVSFEQLVLKGPAAITRIKDD